MIKDEDVEENQYKKQATKKEKKELEEKKG